VPDPDPGQFCKEKKHPQLKKQNIKLFGKKFQYISYQTLSNHFSATGEAFNPPKTTPSS
jgi:hypothetical protein